MFECTALTFKSVLCCRTLNRVHTLRISEGDSEIVYAKTGYMSLLKYLPSLTVLDITQGYFRSQELDKLCGLELCSFKLDGLLDGGLQSDLVAEIARAEISVEDDSG